MLISLSIRNYVLIKELSILPGAGLNIITGETGAGKSIMLGALGLLMGNRADTKTLFDESQKCVIEGKFDLEKLGLQSYFEENDIDYDPQTLIRREISQGGKSRAFVNDQPVTLDILKELGAKLMDIHSQYDTQLLNSPSYQLGIVDAYAHSENYLNTFKKSYTTYIANKKAYEQLLSQAETLKKEFEYNSFLLEELSLIKLDQTNQEELEAELQKLENAEEIKRKLSEAYQNLNHAQMPALSLLKDSVSALGNISQLSPKYLELRERLNSSLIELQDISQELEIESSNVESNDSRLTEIQEVLGQLYKLQKKHAVNSVHDLKAIQEELQQKVNTVLNLSGEIEKLNKTYEDSLRVAEKNAASLSESRKNSIPTLQENIGKILTYIGIPDALFQISVSEKSLSADGIDDLAFRFAANKGSKPKNLKDAASGGEFSRVMLALKYTLATKTQLPTIIFDEIDTGISGEVAVKVGRLLVEMAKSLQVVAITHLPQIAARGTKHFYVFKDNSEAKTISKMRELTPQDRVNEIAEMIGGQNPSESAINSAKELLGL